ncbi:MAG: CRISPR-associated endonuclease Cas1 [Phycisphaerae bacterium]|nr:CRISPR-associated endonuclease Cas1 [Phycisphaerae bacterium]
MPSNVSITGDDALTLDMVGQYTYCPRRFHLMYVEGRWDDNVYTIEGRHVHRRVDQIDHLLPQTDSSNPANENNLAAQQRPAGDEPPVISRSVPLASTALGLSAKLDLVSSDGSEAVPVETKRGRVPDNPERSYDTHRVQLMAQGLLLREHGYTCDHGIVYFAGSRTRVDVPFNSDLESRTRQLIEQTRAAVSLTFIPDPLQDSPKCAGCSLAGICLPDETLALRDLRELNSSATAPPLKPRHGDEEENAGSIRRLYPARPDATPLYVQTQGAYVSKKGESLIVRAEGEELTKVGLKDVAQLVLCGNVQVSTQTMHLLCEADIPIVMLSTGMWFYGITHGQSLRNAFDRAAQFHTAADANRSLEFAKSIVRDKALNQRTLLRRNAPPSPELDRSLDDMDRLISRIDDTESTDVLLGIEGNAARIYFQSFAQTLKPRDFDAAQAFDFDSRNRRPPKDPVNAMLSFAYALLVKECTVALLSEGLDPYWGFYHRPRHGRPALALDLMEPFRAVIADSVVITAINTGMVRASQFTRAANSCAMSDAGRKGLLRAYEARLDQLVTHPIFDYRCSWRSIIRLQARLLSRWLRGDVPMFSNLVTR